LTVTASVITACSSARTPSSSSQLASAPNAVPASALQLKQVHDPLLVTGTIRGTCTYGYDNGQLLPDPKCTPGSYDPSITATILCSPNYRTTTYRAPEDQTTPFKYLVAEPAYGEHHVLGELDHLVSLELGGSNDATNLWPENGTIPNPKDSIENALHRWVCSVTGQASERRLRHAQVAIATNWVTAESILGVSP
jgi:hypothetical protein